MEIMMRNFRSNQRGGWLLKILFIAIGLSVIGSFLPKAENSSSSSSSKDNERLADGLTRGQWKSRCERVAAASNECAAASRFQDCLKIRVGEMDAVMAQTYCVGDTPNWFLMGAKPE
jgi:hypothetical protein